MSTPTIDVPFMEQYIYNSNLIEGVTEQLHHNKLTIEAYEQ